MNAQCEATTVTVEFISAVLSIRDEFTNPYADFWDLIDWRTDDEFAPVTFWVNCNDLFYWACADCEDITPKNLPMVKQAVEDTAQALGAVNPAGLPKDTPRDEWRAAYDLWRKVGAYAADLFCARSRGMRPQRPCYKRYPEALHPLFDACGPERDPASEG